MFRLPWIHLGVAAMLGLVAAPAESSAKVQASAVMHAKQHQVIAELKAARALLEKANHDYQGHRAKAVHEITHAIHLLEHGKHHPNPQTAAGNGNGNKPTAAGGKKGKKAAGNANKPNEPQGQSDAQLKHAIEILHKVEKQLHGGQAQHHRHAAEAIHKAIHELHTALKVA
jgi:hypothetical protein